MISNEEKMAKERLERILNMKHCTYRELADGNESKRILYWNQIKGNAILKFDLLNRFAFMFHDISCEYILLGEGPIKKAEHMGNQYVRIENTGDSHNNGDSVVNVGSNSSYAINKNALEEREQIIAQLRAQVEELKHDKQLQQGIIEALIAGQKK
jgi:hypothetical protein